MPSPPTGTVTFLFTDIEGSTRLWEGQPEAMQAALVRHDALMRRAIEAHHGYVFKTAGDAFFAAFAIAHDALAAALAAQQALHDAEQTANAARPTIVIRVRMGLHTGPTDERDGDYFGPPLNRVARLMAAGHGGQILLSQATYELVRDHLPPTVELRDLGEHRLKDLTRPERIFQVVTPDLLADFAPLRTLDRRPNNLPGQATALIGREKEAADIRHLLLRPDVRLVTLSGPGGIGKTRLGLQVAADVLDEFADGVTFVPLAPVSDPALVGLTIAQTLNLREHTGRPPLDSLKDYLRDKQCLLFLDNFEQVVDAAPLVADLITAAPGLKVLVTSRIVLRLRGEHTVEVPPLALPQRPEPDSRTDPATADGVTVARVSQYEAVRLFIERAQAARPDFTITAHNAPAVAEICYRLDGLPLAIELAAARIRLLTPEAMLQRLGGDHGHTPLRLLTGGARDLPTRQQTLRNTIEWSYQLLDDAEKTLFRRLAVFVGGATLDAVETVCLSDDGPDLDILDGVESLAAKSLLRHTEPRPGETRFGMLETIREFGLERLAESGELADLRRRHAEFYLQWARQAAIALRGPTQLDWVAHLEAEYDNLRAVLDWATEQGQLRLGVELASHLFEFWYMQSRLVEGRRWSEALLARLTPDTPAELRAWILRNGGGMACEQGDFATAHTWLTESVELFRAVGDKTGLANALLFLGAVAFQRSAFAQAQAAYEESAALCRELGDQWELAVALNLIGRTIMVRHGDLDGAQRLCEESLSLLQRLEDRWASTDALSQLAHIDLLRGDYGQATRRKQAILRVFQEFGDRQGMAAAYESLGALALVQGDYAQAETYTAEAMRLHRQLGHRQIIGYMAGKLGEIAYYQGRLEEAADLLEQSVTIGQERGAAWMNTEAVRHLARVRLALGQVAASDRLYRESLQVCRGSEDIYCAAESLVGLAGVATAQGHAERAARLYGAALAAHAAHGLPIWPLDRAEYERQVAPARAQLEEAAFTTAEQAGRVMTLAEAVAYALEIAPTNEGTS